MPSFPQPNRFHAIKQAMEAEKFRKEGGVPNMYLDDAGPVTPEAPVVPVVDTEEDSNRYRDAQRQAIEKMKAGAVQEMNQGRFGEQGAVSDQDMKITNDAGLAPVERSPEEQSIDDITNDETTSQEEKDALLKALLR